MKYEKQFFIVLILSVIGHLDLTRSNRFLFLQSRLNGSSPARFGRLLLSSTRGRENKTNGKHKRQQFFHGIPFRSMTFIFIIRKSVSP